MYEHFCPHDEHQNYYINVGRKHWFLCDTCKTKYYAGENVFSSWRYETERDWLRNAEKLKVYKKRNREEKEK